MSDCLGKLMLAHYVRGELDEVTSAFIDDHVDACAACDAEAARLEKEMRRLPPRETVPIADSNRIKELGATVALSQSLRMVSKLDLERFNAGDQVDDFLILRHLGSGAFASVYLAQNQSLRKLVALKVSKRRSQEAIVLAQLDHPHIVRVFDQRSNRETGLSLLSMEYIAGGTLQQALERLRHVKPDQRRGQDILRAIFDHLARNNEIGIANGHGGLPAHTDWWSAVSWIGARLADGLSFAHEKGCLHRDIKPANVLLSASGNPLLSDFNLSSSACVNDPDSDEHFGGTVAYMSPEQLEVCLGELDPKDVGSKSDIYSLGIVLWELASGAHPFPHSQEFKGQLESLRGIHGQRREGGPPLSGSTPLPAELRELLFRLLAPEAADRPDADIVARSLALISTADVRDLIAESPTNWATRCTRWPISALLFLGIAPNVLVAWINVRCNHGYLSIDSEQLSKDQVPVNFCVFLIGALIPLYLALPIRNVLKRRASPVKAVRSAAERCLALPSLISGLCLALWASTGIAYPILNSIGTGQRITLLGFAEFFSSQVVHGGIAASITFLMVGLASVRSFFPQLAKKMLMPELAPRLEQVRRLTDWHAAILGLLPPSALMLAAYLRQRSGLPAADLSLFFALGLFGAASFALALYVVPIIRTTLDLLVATVTPTEALLRGTSSSLASERKQTS